ncbi:MAG: lysophospholipid acyltransferase family protein [Candidatus Acidiferrales bacterium]
MELGAHRDRLYYTAVTNASKSGAPQNGEQKAAAAPPAIPMPHLSRWRRMQIPVIAWVVYWFVRLIGPTLRLEIVGVHNATQIRSGGEPAIGAFWHRCIFPAVWTWRNRGIVVLNTVNFDGQWTRKVIERLGFGTAQGSSTRGAIEGLTAMARYLEAGRNVALTIDGPRGPRYVAKPGAVILARRTGHPISVFHIGIKRAHTFQKSWDLFQIPYPFSRTVMFIAPPIRVPTDADSDTLKAKQAEVQAALERVRDVAESWFRLTERERDRLRNEWREKVHSVESAPPVPREGQAAGG